MLRAVLGRAVFAAALAAASAPLYAATTTYMFEPQHSEGVIRWDHLGYSHPTAQFSWIQGTLQFDPADPTQASVSATIPIANISSGVHDLDDNFRSSDFFDLDKYASATFKSTRVEKGATPDQLRVTGELNLHGVTRPVTLDVTINKVGINPHYHLQAVGFEASTTLKRSEFGLGLFIPDVGDEVSIHITGQADEAKGYAEKLRRDAAEAAKAAAEKPAADAPNGK